MNLVLSLLALAVLPLSSEAACSLNYKELKSAIDVAKTEVRGKSGVRYSRRARSVSQSITRKDGQVVRYQAGGCEHYSYSFAYPQVKLARDPRIDLARAAELLAATPVTKSGAYGRDLLLSNLRDGAQLIEEDGSAHYFPCGDATCTVGENEAGEFAVSYTFAL